jgi:hypothetical protein
VEAILAVMFPAILRLITSKRILVTFGVFLLQTRVLLGNRSRRGCSSAFRLDLVDLGGVLVAQIRHLLNSQLNFTQDVSLVVDTLKSGSSITKLDVSLPVGFSGEALFLVREPLDGKDGSMTNFKLDEGRQSTWKACARSFWPCSRDPRDGATAKAVRMTWANTNFIFNGYVENDQRKKRRMFCDM